MIQVSKEDLIYLLSMTYGYIDDELGGMDEENNHSVRLRYIIGKYDMSMVEIFNQMNL